MRRLPKMAAALLAAVLAVSAALPALAADQRAELELEASVRCTGEAADETLTVRLTALDGAPMPEGCDDEAELDFPARECRAADDKTLTKTLMPSSTPRPAYTSIGSLRTQADGNGPTTTTPSFT